MANLQRIGEQQMAEQEQMIRDAHLLVRIAEEPINAKSLARARAVAQAVVTACDKLATGCVVPMTRPAPVGEVRS